MYLTYKYFKEKFIPYNVYIKKRNTISSSQHLIQFNDRKIYPFHSILIQFETNSKSSRESER